MSTRLLSIFTACTPLSPLFPRNAHYTCSAKFIDFSPCFFPAQPTFLSVMCLRFHEDTFHSDSDDKTALAFILAGSQLFQVVMLFFFLSFFLSSQLSLLLQRKTTPIAFSRRHSALHSHSTLVFSFPAFCECQLDYNNLRRFHARPQMSAKWKGKAGTTRPAYLCRCSRHGKPK